MAKPVVRKVFSRFGFDCLVLTTLGRRTGKEHSTQVCWFPAGTGGWLVVAAAGGTAANPAWYHNLAAHPDEARVEVDGQTVGVRAEQLHGTARADAWRQIVAAAPRFARFQDQTDRQFPIILLTPRSRADERATAQ